MSRDAALYVADIEECCEKIRRYTSGMDRAAFVADEKTYDAVVRNLEVIGEAAKNLSSDVRAAIQQIDWKKVSGLRDVLSHAYFGIDNDILWDIVENKIPELHAAMNRYRGK